MSETNLQPTQMSGTNHEERKPVMCPWCGGEMKLDEPTAYGWECSDGHWCSDGYICPVCGGSSGGVYGCATREECGRCAYENANQTPPNRALTREQVDAMDDLDAVWIVQRYPYVNERVTIQTASWIKAQYRDLQGDEWAHRKVFFAAPPAPADIEAARKERT